MELHNLYSINSCCINSKQAYRSEYSCIRKVCAPVPAKHTVSFSNVNKAVHCILSSSGWCLFECICYVFIWRVEIYFKLVVFSLKNIFDCKFPCAVHVLYVTDCNFIKPYVCNCVETVKM